MLAIRKVTIIGVFFLAFSGCATTKHLGTDRSEQTQVRIIEHQKVVPVYVEVPVPQIREAVTVQDTSSHLENQYSQSDARINRDGSLYHSLETKPQTIKAKTEARIEYRDSIVTKEVVVEKTVEVKVEKELTWWQKVKMKVGGWALGIILLAIIYMAVRLFLKIK